MGLRGPGLEARFGFVGSLTASGELEDRRVVDKAIDGGGCSPRFHQSILPLLSALAPERANLAATLRLWTAGERRGLLLLVARIVDADSSFDLAESA